MEASLIITLNASGYSVNTMAFHSENFSRFLPDFGATIIKWYILKNVRKGA